MSEKNKLLRCPFCGGEARVTCNTDDTRYYVVSCQSCALKHNGIMITRKKL